MLNQLKDLHHSNYSILRIVKMDNKHVKEKDFLNQLLAGDF